MPAQLSNPASAAVMDLLLEFASRLTPIIQREALAQVRAAIDQADEGAAGAPGGAAPRALRALGPAATLGRTGTDLARTAALTPTKTRKKPPRQLCPVPRCTNTAAPIFGMVCSDHKDVPKAKIKKYREARRAAASKPARGRASTRATA